MSFLSQMVDQIAAGDPQYKKSMGTLEGRFLYYTECQLATLEGLKMKKKKTSKSELRRQQSIADGMLIVVKGFCSEVDIHSCPRVKELLKQ
jgi:hypothetical protein